MTSLVYDGTFEGWLTAVFECYEYKFRGANIQPRHNYQDELLSARHEVITDAQKAARVWKGLSYKISRAGLRRLYYTFLSEEKDIENLMLAYARYAMTSTTSMEHDFSNAAVLKVQQMAKIVHREKHRMEAFVRFELTGDGLFYAIIQPDFNVLPLIREHFRDRYADQRWMIYDSRRKYGIYYDLVDVEEVRVDFSVTPSDSATSIYDENEPFYQKLWQHYFSSINIASRKNTKLHIQHMPRRYWKYLTEKKL